jgi:Ca2+-binding EF-hand superfamily protein
VNEFRKALIRKAFKKLDANKNGVIQLDDIKLFYNAKLNPEVTSGRKTEDQVLLEFLGGFDTIVKDGSVTYEEFEEYYNTISVSIDNDEYFQLMMANTWKIQ